MKLNMGPNKKNCETMAGCAAKTGASAKAGVPERFRRLKWNEVVRHGDFIADEHLGLELWEGPGGFQADTFVKTIYRREETGRIQPTATRKSKRTQIIHEIHR